MVGLLHALSRVGERNSAEIARVMASYFRARDELEPVSRDELLDRLRAGTATVLDVRPEDEFAQGHLPGALNIPLAQLERRLAELPADREIVAYCRGPWCVLSSRRSRRCGSAAIRVRRLEDGFPEWKVAGLADWFSLTADGRGSACPHSAGQAKLPSRCALRLGHRRRDFLRWRS